MSGFEFLSVVRRRFPEILTVAMSGAYLGEELPHGVIADRFYPKGEHPSNSLEPSNSCFVLPGKAVITAGNPVQPASLVRE
jgi:hypothetical protein